MQGNVQQQHLQVDELAVRTQDVIEVVAHGVQLSGVVQGVHEQLQRRRRAGHVLPPAVGGAIELVDSALGGVSQVGRVQGKGLEFPGHVEDDGAQAWAHVVDVFERVERLGIDDRRLTLLVQFHPLEVFRQADLVGGQGRHELADGYRRRRGVLWSRGRQRKQTGDDHRPPSPDRGHFVTDGFDTKYPNRRDEVLHSFTHRL